MKLIKKYKIEIIIFIILFIILMILIIYKESKDSNKNERFSISYPYDEYDDDSNIKYDKRYYTRHNRTRRPKQYY